MECRRFSRGSVFISATERSRVAQRAGLRKAVSLGAESCAWGRWFVWCSLSKECTFFCAAWRNCPSGYGTQHLDETWRTTLKLTGWLNCMIDNTRLRETSALFPLRNNWSYAASCRIIWVSTALEGSKQFVASSQYRAGLKIICAARDGDLLTDIERDSSEMETLTFIIHPRPSPRHRRG